MDKLFTASGFVRKDTFGRIVVDSCPSDEDHLRNSKTDPVSNRPLCRGLVEQAFGDFVGKRGTLTLTITFNEDQSAMPTSEISDDTTRRVVSEAAEKKPSLSKSQLEQSVLAAVEHVDGP